MRRGLTNSSARKSGLSGGLFRDVFARVELHFDDLVAVRRRQLLQVDVKGRL